jgi:hypothetical protein
MIRWLLNATLLAFIVIGASALYTQADIPLIGALPWLLLLICPLTHAFMHCGQGPHGRGPR